MTLYNSQLSHIKSLAARDGITEEAFNERFLTNISNVFQYRPSAGVITFDTVYYLAEKDTWQQLWPREIFPGTDPRTSYASLLGGMLDKARLDPALDMREAEIQRAWMRCLLAALAAWGDLGMEVVQYEAEKTLWEMFWPDGGGFQGKDPRLGLAGAA